MSLSCFTRISQQRCFKRMSVRTKQISQRDFFFLSTLPHFRGAKLIIFGKIFFRCQHFLFWIFFVHQFHHQPDVLSLKEGGNQCWSYVLKSVKIYQLRPTSQCLLITLEGLVVQFMWISPKQLSTPPMSFILAKNMPIMELT